MVIYIDPNNYKCHTANPNGEYKEIETDFFNGKCDTFIEGYRFVPDGESWTRSDGVKFDGQMIAPFVDYSILNQSQKQYIELTTYLQLLGVEV